MDLGLHTSGGAGEQSLAGTLADRTTARGAFF
jgi:hypothetical protein